MRAGEGDRSARLSRCPTPKGVGTRDKYRRDTLSRYRRDRRDREKLCAIRSGIAVRTSFFLNGNIPEPLHESSDRYNNSGHVGAAPAAAGRRCTGPNPRPAAGTGLRLLGTGDRAAVRRPAGFRTDLHPRACSARGAVLDARGMAGGGDRTAWRGGMRVRPCANACGAGRCPGRSGAGGRRPCRDHGRHRPRGCGPSG